MKKRNEDEKFIIKKIWTYACLQNFQQLFCFKPVDFSKILKFWPLDTINFNWSKFNYLEKIVCKKPFLYFQRNIVSRCGLSLEFFTLVPYYIFPLYKTICFSRRLLFFLRTSLSISLQIWKIYHGKAGDRHVYDIL